MNNRRLTLPPGGALIEINPEVISRRNRTPGLGSVCALAQASVAGQEGKGSLEWGVEFFANFTPQVFCLRIGEGISRGRDTIRSHIGPHFPSHEARRKHFLGSRRSGRPSSARGTRWQSPSISTAPSILLLGIQPPLVSKTKTEVLVRSEAGLAGGAPRLNGWARATIVGRRWPLSREPPAMVNNWLLTLRAGAASDRDRFRGHFQKKPHAEPGERLCSGPSFGGGPRGERIAGMGSGVLCELHSSSLLPSDRRRDLPWTGYD